MCEVQAKLIAWLDRELPPDEASAVERHVEGCQKCRRWVATLGEVSETFDAYCDAVMARKAARRVRRWVPVLAGAVVATAVIFLAFPRPRVGPPPVVDPTVATASVPVPGPPAAEPGRRKATVHRRRAAPRVRESATKEAPMDTAIEIAIPAEAMFPPGAMPDGISFIADVRIAPDGSVRQVRLRQ